ncbi:uncharacterized protein PRCAT00005317001 [Priceomyces carsonii]|uniref:uncharacterized protein n=1 Tax=Priceomyces carsonii TaxID=28549 RepID=UPI002ED7F3A2|nr:unnamed protein product [Priceomyces carsonii]
MNCNIPPRICPPFLSKSNSDVKWTVADDDYELTEDIIYRILSTMGLKSNPPDNNNIENGGQLKIMLLRRSK